MRRLHAAAAALAAAAAAPPTTTTAFDCSFAASYPRQYVAYHLPSDAGVIVDGALDEPAWAEVGFTDAFVDISTSTPPALLTRAKLRWSDSHLFVGGLLQEPAVWANISHVCHCVNASQDQVIYHDNDFEVFLDADGSTHYYKETEFNAAANYWDLTLNKPYNDGGYENSSRVFGPAGWDMWPRVTAATATDGVLNDPQAPATWWSVEASFPLSDLAYNTTAAVPPQPGSYWRINFSRVEWAVKVVGGRYVKSPSCQSCPIPGTPVEDNWVWSPQGSIAMHLPERWGMLQFATGPVNATPAVANPEWPLRAMAAAMYNAQHAFAAAHNGSFTDDVAALAPFADPFYGGPGALNGTCTAGLPVVTLSPGGAPGFVAWAVAADGASAASVTDDRYLRVWHGRDVAAAAAPPRDALSPGRR